MEILKQKANLIFPKPFRSDWPF